MIKKIVVIGSGVMGSGIAALIASSGRNVLLLDIGDSAKNAIEKLKTIKPAALTSMDYLPLIKIGSIEKDLFEINDADLVIEVIIENLEIKRQLYAQIENLMGDNTIISSNTSTIKLVDLMEGRNQLFRNNFVITHFFNPPRYMKLLELILNNNNLDKSKFEKIKEFLESDLGKEVVICKDTPGFIANRIGCYFIERGIDIAINHNISDLYFFDQALHEIAGLPKTGIFGLADLIGLDVMKLISKSLVENLDKDDAYQKINLSRPTIDNLIVNGFNGRKGKGGFYKIEKKDGKSEIFTLNFNTGQHEIIIKKNHELCNLEDLPSSKDPNLQAVWQILEEMLVYTLNIASQIAENIYDIDRAIKFGYNWKFGPFEMIDKIGSEKLKQSLKSKNISIPELLNKKPQEKQFYNNSNYLDYNGSYQKIIVDDKKITLDNKKILLSNKDARLLDLNDRVLCFEILTKMNILTENVFLLLQESIKFANDNNYLGIVIGDNDRNFCAGADLSYFYEKIKTNDHDAIKRFLLLGQNTMMQIKYSNVPILAALKGVALGGGCEILMHAKAICAHIESSFGLVESKVGLLPGWGGVKEFYLRNQSLDDKNLALNSIMEAKIFENAEMLKSSPFSINNLKIIFDDQHLLFRAKEFLLELTNIDPNKISTTNANVNSGDDLIKDNYSLKEIFNIFSLKEYELLNLEQELFLKAVMEKDTLQKIERVIKPTP